MKPIKAQISIITFFVLLFCQISLAQEFLISDLAAVDFSVDRRARVIYLDHLFSDAVFSYNLNTNKLDTTEYHYCPQFANKNYWAFAHDYGFIDCENDTLITFENLEDFHGGFLFSFSPNDLGFVGNNGNSNYAVNPNSYYSIPDKKLYNSLPESLGLRWERPSPSWASDTTMMFSTINNGVIVEINLKTGEVDTVYESEIENDRIVGFKYSPGDDFLFYVNSEFDWQRIWNYDLESKESEVFYDFDTENPESHCRGTYFGFESLQWSPNKKKIAFVGFFYTISASSIYCHFTDSNKTYLYGICDDYGLKYDVEWLDNDTIIYRNATDARIYGYDLTSSITSVKNSEILPTEYLSIQNYPNPFNAATILKINMPSAGDVNIRIYNTIGELIRIIDAGYLGAGQYNFKWRGKDNNGYEVGSGVYLALVEFNGSNNKKKNAAVKLLCLK